MTHDVAGPSVASAGSASGGKATKYQRYIHSIKWRKFKRRILLQRGQACEACGVGGIALELHHKTYDRLGCESPDDVSLLCHECHMKADELVRAVRA